MSPKGKCAIALVVTFPVIPWRKPELIVPKERFVGSAGSPPLPIFLGLAVPLALLFGDGARSGPLPPEPSRLKQGHFIWNRAGGWKSSCSREMGASS